MRHSNYPILVGFGQVRQRVDDPQGALEPIGARGTVSSQPTANNLWRPS